MTRSLSSPATDALSAQPLDLEVPIVGGRTERPWAFAPLSRATALGPPVALVVSEHLGDAAPFQAALRDEGWLVTQCAGPGGGDCPLMRGERCSLRESVDAAVVFVDMKGHPGGLGTIPRLRCAADSASPGVVAVENSIEPTRYGGGTACVGALRGPNAVLKAISALLACRHSD